MIRWLHGFVPAVGQNIVWQEARLSKAAHFMAVSKQLGGAMTRPLQGRSKLRPTARAIFCGSAIACSATSLSVD